MLNLETSNLTKQNIVKHLHSKIGVSISYNSKVFDDLIQIYFDIIKEDKKLILKNFCTFTLKKKKERLGRNPKKAKHEYMIPSKNVLSVKFSKVLLEKMNKKITNI